MFSRCTLVAMLVLVSSVAVARPQHSVNWLGGTGSWHDPTRWSGGVVPNNSASDTYDVTIGNVGAFAYIGLYEAPSSFVVDSLMIQDGVSFRWPYLNTGTTTLESLDGVVLDGRIEFDFASKGTISLGTNGVLKGHGVVDGTTSGYQDGWIRASSGTTTIDTGITISGGVGIGHISAAIVNRGVIQTDGGQIVLNASSIYNTGSILCSGGQLTINSDFSLDSIGTLINTGGLIRIGGNFDNTNRTFYVDDAHGNWALAGTMNGGTFESGNGRALVVDYPSNGTFNNVVVNGQVNIGTNRTLFIPAGQTLHGTGTIQLGIGTNTAGVVSTETIEPAMTVRGRGTIISGTEPGALTPLLNRGHVVADVPGGVLDLRASTLLNTGSIEVKPGAILGIGSTFKIDELGTVINNGGILRITGTLDNANRTFQVNDSSGTWELAGTIRGGTVEIQNGRTLHIPKFGVATFDDVFIRGAIDMGSDYGGTINMAAGSALRGVGTLTLGPSMFNAIYCDNGNSTLNISSGMTVIGGPAAELGWTESISPIVNEGTIRTGTALSIYSSHLYNRGVIEVSPGTILNLHGGIDPADLGTLVNNGTIRLRGHYDNTGRTFQPGVTVPGVWQIFDATITGGVVTNPPGQPLGILGLCTLEDVTLNGSFFISRQVLFRGGELTGNAEVRVNGGILDGQPTLAIGSDITVLGGATNPSPSDEYGVGWQHTQHLFNNGTILATRVDNTARQMRIRAGEVDHFGTIGSLSGATFNISTSVFHHAGTVTLDANARLHFKEIASLYDTDVIVEDGGAFVIGVGSSTGTGNPFFDLAGIMYFDGLLDLGTLDDYLTVVPQTGFDPARSYKIMLYDGPLIGQFDHVTTDWVVDYSVGGEISVRYVPEPDIAAFCALTVAATMVRKRSRSFAARAA